MQLFTDRDWLFLTGQLRGERVLSLHLWLRFAVLWFAVVLIGFVEVTYSCRLVLQPSLAPCFSALVVWRVASFKTLVRNIT